MWKVSKLTHATHTGMLSDDYDDDTNRQPKIEYTKKGKQKASKLTTLKL
jgi:hypothetical protein